MYNYLDHHIAYIYASNTRSVEERRVMAGLRIGCLPLVPHCTSSVEERRVMAGIQVGCLPLATDTLIPHSGRDCASSVAAVGIPGGGGPSPFFDHLSHL